jgi:twitching motility protein PilT
MGLAMRCIPMRIPTIDELDMPDVLKSVARIHRGMVLLTGITGSGKSTTLAAMIHHLNNFEARRVITIEDPIEYVYPPVKCIISQREVGDDIPDFATGLRQALRMDPDVILIGEMRDLETIRVAIKAAETGHLLLSTLHTTGAVHTIQRVIGHYPEQEHDLVREQLSLNLKASITQRLLKKADGTGRMAAQEIMICTDVISKLIQDNRIPDIFPIIRGREAGMQTFDQALADLVRAGKVTFEEGKKYCEDFYAYRRYIRGVSASSDKGSILSAG